ncbi:MAG: site-specific integrase [Lachnospiraceae bacterium]|nr:site-specific integrase [Lachnospiraceae bacterium]
MAKEKRKDSKGYVLKTGECQRKDGRYSFSCSDRYGKRHTIYAKSLVDIREKEKKLLKDLGDDLDAFAASRTTLNELYDRYISQKRELKPTTKSNYIYMYNRFVRNDFGKRIIGNIRYSDIRKFYFSLLYDKGMKGNTLDNVHTQLHPAFQMAVRDGILRLNPTDEAMTEIKKSGLFVKPKRHALTIPQQRAFLNFLEQNDEFKGWYPIITVLLGTGMRIGECLGLRWEDVSFGERLISVNHNLSDRPVGEEHKCERHILTPKTDAGTRTIPVLDDVFDAFLLEYQYQLALGFCEEEIDGYSGFIFSTATGNLYQASAVNNAIHRATKLYNSLEEQSARDEKREPIILPDFSAHNLRHTFCTRLCENESNLKVIQDIMGHSDIKTTMDIYAEVTKEKQKEVMTNLNGKIIIK